MDFYNDILILQLMDWVLRRVPGFFYPDLAWPGMAMRAEREECGRRKLIVGGCARLRSRFGSRPERGLERLSWSGLDVFVITPFAM